MKKAGSRNIQNNQSVCLCVCVCWNHAWLWQVLLREVDCAGDYWLSWERVGEGWHCIHGEIEKTSVLFFTMVNHYMCCNGSKCECCLCCLHLKKKSCLLTIEQSLAALIFWAPPRCRRLLVTRMCCALCWGNLIKLERGCLEAWLCSNHATWVGVAGGVPATPTLELVNVSSCVYFFNYIFICKKANFIQLLQCLWHLQWGA